MGKDLPDFYSDALFRVLLQRAVTERRLTISNNGPTPSGPFPFDVLKGKFFSRGMRGFVEAVELYLKGADVDVTITISFRVYPEGGEIFSVNYTLPAGAEEGWKTVTVRRPWLYDSMFMVCDSTDRTSPVHYEDYGTPYDAYAANPAAPQEFEPWNIRFWWRVVMTALTPGDVPVSGTINAVIIPATQVTLEEATAVNVDGGATGDLLPTVNGVGVLTCFVMRIVQVSGTVESSNMGIHFVVDGVDKEILVSSVMRPLASQTNTFGRVSMGEIDETYHRYQINFNFDMPFQRSLRIYVENHASPGNLLSAYAIIAYKLQR